MSNVKHSIAHRLFAVILALVMVVGMLPTTALRAEAVEVKWISITVKDGEGNPIEGAAIQATLTESDGTTPVFSGGFVTNAEGIAKIHTYSVDGQLLSATITAEGYQDASLAASTVDAEHLNFDVVMTATQTPQPPQTPKIEDVTIVAKSNLVYTGVAQDLVSVTEVEGDVITYEVDGGAASNKAQGIDAKSYSVKVTVKRTGYEDLVETVTATIAPAEIEIDIEGKQLAYNETNQELVTLTGSFEDGDVVTWQVGTQDTGSKDIPTAMAVADYEITLTVERDSNYKIFHKTVNTKIIEGELKLENLKVTGFSGIYTVENGEAVKRNAVKVENQGNYTLQYQLGPTVDNNAWQNTIPTVSEAGSYIVWVKAVKPGYTDKDVPVIAGAGAVAPYNVFIEKAKQTFVFDNADYRKESSVEQIGEVPPFANKTFDFKAEDTAKLANGTISYTVELAAEDQGIATIDNAGLLTVTHPGVITVVATLSGNSNYEPCTIRHELQVAAVVAVPGQFVQFGSDNVDYIVGRQQGVASQNVAARTVAADTGKITYSIENKDAVGLDINAQSGKVTVADYTKLIAAMELCPESWSNRLRMTELWVHPDFQKQGLGGKLMDFAKDYMRKKKYRTLMLETQSCNVNAVDFYLHKGLTLIGFDACCYNNKDLERKEVRLEMGWFPEETA